VDGCSAAGSSETAAGSALVDAVDTDEVLVAAAVLELAAAAADDVEEEDEEEPQPAIASEARASSTKRAWRDLIWVMMAL